MMTLVFLGGGGGERERRTVMLMGSLERAERDRKLRLDRFKLDQETEGGRT